MGAHLTPRLEDLRAGISDEQRALLGAIWRAFALSNANQGAPVQSIHLRFDKNKVREALSALPAGAVHITQNQYRLTLLGLLLTHPQGTMAEQFLVDYFEFIREAALKNPDLSTVKSSEVRTALGLSDDEVTLLGQAISLGGFWSNASSLGGPQWSVGPPGDIDEFPSIRDFREYIARRAVNDAQRFAASDGPLTGAPPKSDFWFVRDPALRKQLQADRQEMLRVREVKAWKSCVILCGGLLEGMLVDVLGRDVEAARAALSESGESPPKDFEMWRLTDYVNVARELGMLPKGAIHLGHALKEFRNLNHPMRQLREGLQLTADEAEVAVRAVDICFRALANHSESAALARER